MKFGMRASKEVVMSGFNVCLDALGLKKYVLVDRIKFWWCLKVFRCSLLLLLCELSLLVLLNNNEFM